LHWPGMCIHRRITGVLGLVVLLLGQIASLHCAAGTVRISRITLFRETSIDMLNACRTVFLRRSFRAGCPSLNYCANEPGYSLRHVREINKHDEDIQHVHIKDTHLHFFPFLPPLLHTR
jgi:hypothetical protein